MCLSVQMLLFMLLLMMIGNDDDDDDDDDDGGGDVRHDTHDTGAWEHAKHGQTYMGVQGSMYEYMCACTH
jgi:hypothetical protein